MKKYIILFSLFLFSFVLQANNKIDSLQTMLSEGDLDQKERIELLMKIGNEYKYLENYHQTIIYYKNALVQAELIEYKDLWLMYSRIGIAYRMIGNYEKALKYYFNALKHVEDNEANKSTVLTNIASVYGDVKELDNALKYLQKSIELYEVKGDTNNPQLTLTYLNIGEVYSYMGDYEKGLYYIERSRQLMSIENEPYDMALLYNNIGSLHEKQGKYTEALESYNKALSIFRSINNKEGIGISLYYTGRICFRRGNLDEAITTINEALKYLEEVKLLSYVAWAYELLSEIYAANNNFKEAYHYGNLRTNLTDSLFGPQVYQKLSDIQLEYELEILDAKNKLEIKILEKNKTLNNYRWAAIVGVLVIIFGGLYNRRLSQKKIVEIKYEKTNLEKLRLSDELDFKNKELTSYTLHLIQKNKMLSDIQEKLIVTKNSSAQEKNRYIQELLSLIKSSSNFDKDWEDFKMIFEQVNNDFYITLQNRFPKLTPNELNLCALFKINLSSKEIAVMIGISPHGVNTARYRLRKKMELSKDEDLVKFIMSI